ncbi:alpha-ketoacid dehydrogenase subunit alpha/beta [Nakamurella leprariae]|uniref:dihydrolipoyllysine-residue succinyltransferase n=1 Tax=Nakamurella leprariae TaxID=2803911 RepID=A0A939BY84_9ACTN|nr:dehydrogenase E1 component subunit alpha/beta [Nakamurella leprariae]MBM9466810.1 dehydrogenase E1 component subunit alpha/beta [Nakamurella leprariae]
MARPDTSTGSAAVDPESPEAEPGTPVAEQEQAAVDDHLGQIADLAQDGHTDVLRRLGKESALAMLQQMVEIRHFEQMAYLRYLQAEIPGTLHQSQGQEAVAVGVCQPLRRTDWITSTHRPHGHALAKGMRPDVAMAEIYGREPGALGGRGGSMHLGDPDLGILPSIAIVGGGITIAPGLAMALQHHGTDGVVACFFGDGASNEGAFHEGVNYAAVKRLPVVFVCENNLYGASTPFHETTLNVDIAARGASYGIPSEQVDGMNVLAVVAAMERAVQRARAGEGATLLECLTYRYVGHSRGDARGYRTKQEEQFWKDRDPIEQLRRALVDAGVASTEEADEAVGRAKVVIKDAVAFAQQAPKAPSETAVAPSAVLAAPPRPQTIGAPLADGPEDRRLSIAEALREGIREEMAADADVVLLGEDVGVPGGFGGAFGIYLGLAEEFGRSRVIDTPISEKAIMGVSIGAGIAGMKPLPDLQYADFVFEGMDELVNEAAKLRYMSGARLSVPMVLRCPVGATQRGAQHAQCPESFFMHVPGLKVLCISDPYTAKGGIRAALRDPDPVLVFEHKLLYGSKKRQEAGSIDTRAYVPPDEYITEVGQARLRRPGTDVTVLATFTQLYAALSLADELEREGISIEVIDPVWLAPFDWESLYESVGRTRRLVVAHEAHRTGGWGAEVAARVGEHLFDRLAAPVRRVATKDVPMPFAPWLESAVLPSTEELATAIRDVAGQDRPAAAARTDQTDTSREAVDG